MSKRQLQQRTSPGERVQIKPGIFALGWVIGHISRNVAELFLKTELPDKHTLILVLSQLTPEIYSGGSGRDTTADGDMAKV